MALALRLASSVLRPTQRSLLTRVSRSSGAQSILLEEKVETASGHAATHWKIERVLAISMLPMYPIALYFDCMPLNYIVTTAVTLHAYWGMDGVLHDYIMDRRYGTMLRPVLCALWKVFCAAGFAGLCYFNYSDIGVAAGIKKLWSI